MSTQVGHQLAAGSGFGLEKKQQSLYVIHCPN